MDDYVEEFIYTKGTLTQEHYGIDLSHFRKWLRANNMEEDVTGIRLLHVQRYLKTLPDSPAKRRRIIALRSFFHHLYVNEHIPKNPVQSLKVPSSQRCRVERRMSRKEVDAVLSKAEGKVQLLVYILFFLGLRISEALRLKKKDIKHGERLKVYVLGKRNKTRDVYAGKSTSIFLWNEIKHLKDEEYLFPSRKKHLTRWWARKQLKKLNPKISPHWLRHAFCSFSLQNGCDVGTVSLAMGHTDLSTTQKYCHRAEKPASEYLEVTSHV